MILWVRRKITDILSNKVKPTKSFLVSAFLSLNWFTVGIVFRKIMLHKMKESLEIMLLMTFFFVWRLFVYFEDAKIDKKRRKKERNSFSEYKNNEFQHTKSFVRMMTLDVVIFYSIFFLPQSDKRGFFFVIPFTSTLWCWWYTCSHNQ